MKNLMFITLLLLTVVSFSRADTLNREPKVLYQTNDYTVYCIENYKWLKWRSCNPQQMFENQYGNSIPVACK